MQSWKTLCPPGYYHNGFVTTNIIHKYSAKYPFQSCYYIYNNITNYYNVIIIINTDLAWLESLFNIYINIFWFIFDEPPQTSIYLSYMCIILNLFSSDLQETSKHFQLPNFVNWNMGTARKHNWKVQRSWDQEYFFLAARLPKNWKISRRRWIENV